MIGRILSRLRLGRWVEIIVPGLLLAGAALVSLQQPALLTHLQNLVWDNYQRAKPRIYQPMPVRIVDIDEESLKRLGQWPWPRTEIARLVDRLAEMGALTVVYDILFSEPDRISPKSLQNFFGDQPENSELSNALALLPDLGCDAGGKHGARSQRRGVRLAREW